MNKYTLDRFEGQFAVFLKLPQEVQQLIIHKSDLDKALKVGDIVTIIDDGREYKVQFMQKETAAQKDNIQRIKSKLNRQQL